MSKVALSGNASGTGTFTIASPNSNVDRVLSLPDQTGTILTTATAGVPVNGPAFRAYATTTQSLTTAVATKVVLNAEVFDTANCFSTSTYRFTPNVAGYYQFTGNVYVQSGSTMDYNYVQIYKNGSPEAGTIYGPYMLTQQIGGVSSLTYMNGSTDYVELYIQTQAAGSILVNGGAAFVFLSGFLARSAT